MKRAHGVCLGLCTIKSGLAYDKVTQQPTQLHLEQTKVLLKLKLLHYITPINHTHQHIQITFFFKVVMDLSVGPSSRLPQMVRDAMSSSLSLIKGTMRKMK